MVRFCEMEAMMKRGREFMKRALQSIVHLEVVFTVVFYCRVAR
jgi:hypothetical protein